MKPFLLSRKCDKCGFYTKIPDIEYKVGIFEEVGQKNICNTMIGDIKQDDYLLRTCQRCGYKWPEHTIDFYDEVNE